MFHYMSSNRGKGGMSPGAGIDRLAIALGFNGIGTHSQDIFFVSMNASILRWCCQFLLCL